MNTSDFILLPVCSAPVRKEGETCTVTPLKIVFVLIKFDIRGVNHAAALITTPFEQLLTVSNS